MTLVKVVGVTLLRGGEHGGNNCFRFQNAKAFARGKRKRKRKSRGKSEGDWSVGGAIKGGMKVANDFLASAKAFADTIKWPQMRSLFGQEGDFGLRDRMNTSVCISEFLVQRYKRLNGSKK